MEQEATYPIPIYCYRTVRHEKRGIATPSLLLIAFLMPHCPVTVVQRYRDGGMQPLVPLVFHNLPPLYPLHLPILGCANAPSKQCWKNATIVAFFIYSLPSLWIPPFPGGSRIVFRMQHAGPTLCLLHSQS